MRYVLRTLSHPAIIMMSFGGLYAGFQVPPGQRLGFFVVIAMTAVGATELVAAAVGLILTRTNPHQGYAHALTGMGACLIAFAALQEVRLLPWVVGCVVFALGGILTLRTLNVRQ
jgi:hypothetical protein